MNKKNSQLDNKATIHNIRLDSHFTITSNASSEDSNISWAAKGLLWYILSRPKDWKIYVNQLSKIYCGPKKGSKKDAIQELLRELRDAGYIVYLKYRDSTGKWAHRYDVYPSPKNDFQKMFPERDQPALEDPAPDNPVILPSTDLPSTDYNPPLSSPPEIQKPKAKKGITPAAEEEEFSAKMELLENSTLSPAQKKRLCIFPLKNLQEAFEIARHIPPKKGLMNLLMDILKNPGKYDKPEEELTQQQRLALEHNEEIRQKGFTKGVDENAVYIRENHMMKLFGMHGEPLQISLKQSIEETKKDIKNSRVGLEKLKPKDRK